MNGPPVAGEPAWVADPTARHQLRWWDGVNFTDQVADGGVTSTDPFVGGTMPTVPTVGGALPADVTGKKPSRLPIILAAVGAFVVVLALLTLLGGDDGGTSGTGEFAGEITDDDEEGRHRFALSGGTALVVTVEPDDDLDAVVGFEVEGDAADEVEDVYQGTPLEAPAAEEDGLVFRRDIGFEGDDEVTFLAVPFDVDGEVVVSGFGDTEGEYEITIEAVELELEEDADGDDVLDALRDADVPREVRDALEG